VTVDTAFAALWVKEGDSLRCPRHGELFDPSVATCAGCEASPGPDLHDEIDDPLPSPPDGCVTTEEIERALVAAAWDLRKVANDLTRKSKGKNKIQALSVAAKYWDTALKALRAAADLALRREDEALVKAREKRIRDRARGTSN
jgi:hypothetical protein